MFTHLLRNTTRLLFPLTCSLMLLMPATTTAQRVTDLRCERLTDPLGIDTPTPRLGWRIEATQNDVMQTAYHLIVSSSKEKAETLEGDLCDQTVTTDQSQWVEPQLKLTPRSNTRCYWRVKVSTNKGDTDCKRAQNRDRNHQFGKR